MTDTFKVLAQLNISSTGSLQTLYTVPASTSTTISSIVVCNQNSSTITFRITIRSIAGLNTDQPIYFDLSSTANNTFIATSGFTLATGDIVKVQSNTSNVTFHIFGVEVS